MDKTRSAAKRILKGRKPKPKQNHILAIAIDNYSEGQVPLHYPVEECERLIHLLTEQYNFQPSDVTRIYDDKATKEVLRDELYELPNKLEEQDNLLLIFAGHGFYNDKLNEGYWIPVDAPTLVREVEAEDLFFPFQRIVKLLNRASIHHIVFVIDSCFGGKFGQITMGVPSKKDTNQNKPEEIPSRWVLSSGRIQEVADYSPFAKAMWEILDRNTQVKLPLSSLYTEIRNRMETTAAQTAYCTEIVEGENRGGEFHFSLREGLSKLTQEEKSQDLDSAELLHRLRQGSQAYLDYLKKGRFAKLQFEKILLPEAEAELLDVEVKLEEEQTPLRQALEQLWNTNHQHTLLCGEGGMGKTVSCVHLWEELLEAGDKAPLPIFLPLNEYNATTQAERESKNYLYQFIAKEYLDDIRLTPELEDALKQLLKKTNEQPTIILLLDGFNEISVEENELMVELAEFVRRNQGVQIAVTSRFDIRNYTWTQGFERLDLSGLSPDQVESYLAKHSILLPEADEVQALLSIPMMLTLYTGASQLQDQFREDQRLLFKSHVSTKGELLHNFIEGQLAKYLLDNSTNPNQEQEFLWQTFLLRHFLPFLAYRMVTEGQFFIHRRRLSNPSFNFKLIIEAAYAYWSAFDFTDLYAIYEGKRPWLGFGIADKDYDALEERQSHIRSYITRKLFLLAEEADTFAFLHQNFRDYFAAVHIQREMEVTIMQNKNLSPEKRRFPASLRQAPLDFYVRQMLGELEGEHINKPKYLEKARRWNIDHVHSNNLLAELLELGRGVFDQEQLGYTLWNILTIWTEQRGELSGANLEELNLRGFHLNGLRTSRPGLSIQFSNGKITAEDVFSQGHWFEIRSSACSPDGVRIVTGSDDRTAKIWDSNTGMCLMTLEGHSHAILSVAYSPDGEHIVTGSEDKTAKIWDSNTGMCLMTLEGHSYKVMSVFYSPDGARIITGSSHKTTKIWDANSGKCLMTLEGHSLAILSIAYSPNGARIVTGSYDKTAKIWDANTGKCLITLKDHLSWVTSTAYSPDGAKIVTASINTAKIWDANTGNCLIALEGHSFSINSSAYSPDGTRIITGSDDNTAKVWDVNSGKCLMSLEGHSQSVNSSTYSSDGTRIITGSGDKTVKIWDANTGKCLKTLDSYTPSVNSAVYSPNGTCIITSSDDNTTKLWDANTGKCLMSLKGHSQSVNSSTYSPNGTRIITGSDDNTAKVWDVNSGKCLMSLEGHSSSVLSTVYSPDGTRILTGAHDDTAKVWDANTGKCLMSLKSHLYMVMSAVYSPDGTQIVIASGDAAEVWDANTGKHLISLGSGWFWTKSTTYNPDGTRIVVSYFDNIAEVWNTETEMRILTLEGHLYRIHSTAYSPDGARILTGSYDNTAKVWDANSGKCLITLKDHSHSVNSTTYSPDGARILTGSSDGTAKVWDAKSGKCLMTLPNIPGLMTHGCDFRDLHSGSEFTEEEIALLRQYGGIFNEEDAKEWAQLMELHFNIQQEE